MNSNYNMIRVWGGGVYQPTEFYDECDRNGLMVWQEFMFACATYPRDQNFLHEVALEVQETALRLGSHPSIFVFGGNNENEVGLEWYQESRDNRDLFVADYVKLYGDTVFGTLQKVLGTNFY
jgi:beta-mannosidase